MNPNIVHPITLLKIQFVLYFRHHSQSHQMFILNTPSVQHRECSDTTVQELHDHEFGIKLVSIRIVLFHRFS